MTKEYPIISLNGFLYAVDKKIEIRKDSTCSINNVAKTIQDGWKPVTNIVASNDPSLTDVFKLPEIQEDIDGLALKEYPFTTQVYESYNELYRKIWTNGYKAASKDKKYSEEDIVKALFKGFDFCLDNWDSNSSTSEIKPQNVKDFLACLKPIPIAVEIEMESFVESHSEWSKELSSQEYEKGYPNTALRPKLENEFVKVKRWIYETLDNKS